MPMKSTDSLIRSVKSLQKSKPFSTLLFLFAGLTLLQANPTGGSVASGSASISGTGTSSVTINQASNIAIINWNSFSIGQGELTTFLQPSRSSAVLNRVTGGGISSIDGTLNANGQVFLINGNGIFVGKSGVVNTAGFTASTEDISNNDFLSGKYQFSGDSTAGVQNLGTINALGGDIYLIGHTVDNEGALNAASGTVGLAAAQSVLIQQSGSEHVFVEPSPTAVSDPTATAVTNNGAITAAAAELRAANGNMYALAINNGGTIRATTVANQGGHVFLTSDSGTIVNTGSVDVSATAAQGAGGQVTLKTSGTVVNHGQIIAHGGQGGTGGTVDLSGGVVDFAGGVNLTTPGGTTGNLLLDPSSITIDNNTNANGTITTTGTTTTYTPAPNFVGSELFTGTLEAQLAIANVIVNGVNNVTVANAITWGDATASTSGMEFANSLTLQTTAKGGTIVIDAPITGLVTPIGTPMAPSTLSKATLILDAFDNGFITTGTAGTIDVDNFILKNGFWQQIVSNLAPTKTAPGYIPVVDGLPAFNVTNDFQLLNTSTFERFAGGNGLLPTTRAPGNSPYQIVDIFGLQGIGSPSDTLLGKDYILDNDINYNGTDVTNTTVNWNGGDGTDGGAGWVPIGEGGTTVKPFTGVFNGNGFVIGGFYYYRPEDNLTGLFAEVSGTVENVGLDIVGTQGIGIGAALVGRLNSGGLVDNSVATAGNLAGEPAGPADPSTGTTANQSDLPQSSLGVSAAAAGLIGETMKGSTVIDCDSDIVYTLLGGNGIQGLIGFAGLVGVNYGTIIDSATSGSGSTAVSVMAVAGGSTSVQNNSISLGGLVGTNFGTIDGCDSVGTVTAVGGTGDASILSGTGNFYIGGLVGVNYGTIDGSIRIKVSGHYVTETYQSFTTDDVTGPVGGDVEGGTGSYYVGGFVGGNYGTINDAYSAPTITGVTGTGLGVVTGNGNLDGPGADAGALGDYAVGGFAGGNFGKINKCGTEDTVVSNGNIAGIANVTTTTKGVTTTAPATVSFSNPLAMDSIFVGGFVGLNGARSSITNSFSDTADQTINFTLDPLIPPTVAPLGDTFTLSSLAGNNDPLVSSTGLITGGNGFYIVGGFAGGNYGRILTSYSTGDVLATGTTTQSNSFYVAGFSGVNSGTIEDDFATGNATSVTSTVTPNNQTGVVGGLVAQNNKGGSIGETYSLGTVTGGTTRGGLVGVSIGSVSHSFWDVSNNGVLLYSAGGAGALAETTAAMQADTADLSTSIYAHAKWNFKTIWVVTGTPGFPTLQNVP